MKITREINGITPCRVAQRSGKAHPGYRPVSDNFIRKLKYIIPKLKTDCRQFSRQCGEMRPLRKSTKKLQKKGSARHAIVQVWIG